MYVVKFCNCSSVWSCLMALSWLTHIGLATLSVLSQHWIVIWLLIWFQMVSLAHGAQTETLFPDISFSAFNQIIESTFGPNISLATVLTLLFTITENVDLLNLHFRQQHPEFQGENKTQTTGWLIALSRALINQLGSTASSLYDDEEQDNSTLHDKVKLVAGKLNDMAVNLNLTPYDDQDAYMGKLLPISHRAIQPVHMICPGSLVCGTAACRPRSLVQAARKHDIPTVTLIKDHKIYKNVSVLTGKCPDCETSYSADHERFFHELDMRGKRCVTDEPCEGRDM